MEDTRIIYIFICYYSNYLFRLIINYLNFKSINWLNLYSHDNNNPIGIVYSGKSIDEWIKDFFTELFGG